MMIQLLVFGNWRSLGHPFRRHFVPRAWCCAVGLATDCSRGGRDGLGFGRTLLARGRCGSLVPSGGGGRVGPARQDPPLKTMARVVPDVPAYSPILLESIVVVYRVTTLKLVRQAFNYLPRTRRVRPLCPRRPTPSAISAPKPRIGNAPNPPVKGSMLANMVMFSLPFVVLGMSKLPSGRTGVSRRRRR